MRSKCHPYLPNAGTSEVSVSASINFEPNHSYAVVGRYGYFFNRHFELGLDASYTKVKNGQQLRLLGCGRVRKLSLSDGHTVVALRRPVRWVAGGKDLDSAFSWGAQGGAKYFFNPNVAGFGELRWRDLEKGDDQSGIFFGLSIFFR